MTLESEIAADPAGVTKKAGLSGQRGPNRLPGSPPSSEAWDLAVAQARLSLGPLRDALAAVGPRLVGNRWPVHTPDELTSEAATMGIPLLSACSEAALFAAGHMLLARERTVLMQLHDDYSVRLAQFLAYEHSWWDLAAGEGGPSPRIPYAFAFCGLEWFWSPNVHKIDRAPVPCLRCGSLIVPRKRQAITSPPRCAHCSNESPEARTWPDHAVAPAERGTWWLRCRGCRRLFVGRRQARRCPNCDLSRITPSRRKHPTPLL